MRRFREFTRQILTREMKILMQVQAPLGTIRHIINDAVVGDELPCAALTCVTAQFHFSDDTIRDAHVRIIQGIAKRKISQVQQEIFL